MAWIQIIDEDEATGELKAIYDEITQRRGKMSNIMRVHSLHPAAMQAHMMLDFFRRRLRMSCTIESVKNGMAPT